MSLEMEAKMKVSNFDDVRARLEAGGAEAIGEFFETNTLFDDDRGSLRSADKGLRVRRSRDVVRNRDHFTITFKGPRQPGVLKNRQEIELSVDDGDGDDATRLFEALGFSPVLCFEKKRQSWRFRDCRVELDEVPHLGAFVEIEGPGEREVLRARDELGLADHPLIKASYVALLTAHLREQGGSIRHITFAAS